MSSMASIEWEQCLLQRVDDPEALRAVRKQLTMVPTAVHYFLGSPWIIRAIVSLNVMQLPLVSVPAGLRGLIPLVVSQDNSCRYCYEITRSTLKVLGVPEEHIERIEQDLPVAEFSAKTRACLDFARHVSRANPLATRHEAAPLLAAGFSVDTVKEITFFTAVNIFFNRLATLPALPIVIMEQEMGWAMRTFRPLFTLFLRVYMGSQLRRKAAPRMLRPEERVGPMAPLINALDGLPAASLLRGIVNDAWASPVLPRRAKAIVFAVVARGLGCCLSEADAVKVLHEEGLTEEQAENVLSHFDAPGLTAQERVIAPFARETIWYRAVQIQRRTRELQGGLTDAELVEVIGLAALANTVCRLSVAADLSRADA